MMPLLLLAPLLAALAAILINRRENLTRYIALAGCAASLALLPFLQTSSYALPWIKIGASVLEIDVAVAPLNVLLLALVLGIGLLTILYSFGFMELPSEQRRYYAELLAFEAAMVAFAVSGGFVLMFIAWEFLSLTSYLLIGFWHSRERANRAARKAVTTVLLGDVALLASMAIFFDAFGTLQFSSIVSSIGSQAPFIAVLLLAVAIFTKSAQFPFHEWLTDAMEGPTPVSAFLHSSTMVKAGVFVAILLYPIFSAAHALGLLVIVGAITAVLSLLDALTERQIKRVLAYSTIQELGLMLLAVGSGAVIAAMYFFFVQSFYKALLFFSAGASMKANGKEDLDELRGIKSNKLIYISTLTGVLSLAGFVPFSGFFAAAGISFSLSYNLAAYALVMAIGFGTSFYIFRWLTLQMKRPSSVIEFNYKTEPRSMLIPMAVLAALTVGASLLFFSFQAYLSTSAAVAGARASGVSTFDAALETALAVVGAYTAYRIYSRIAAQKTARKRRKEIAAELYTAVEFNEAYGLAARAAEAMAAGVALFEVQLNSVSDLVGHATIGLGTQLRRLATGEENTYIAIFVVTMLLLILIFVIL